CNFGALHTVPEKYRSRQLYEWNSQVTLMRTNVAENRSIGKLLAETVNQCAGPVAVVLPMRGVSMLDAPGGPFWDEEADRACYEALKEVVRPGVRIMEIDANINDPVFADIAANVLLEMLTGDVERTRAAGALMESR
ncbi:MAG TPA: Tm-1-like ATP-binding domain-containing protein, partial [Bryobacteraceae bacterium]|nr:Tm-1-like ATP-binding domain-containing protein [Bryobacteraceae bacterium]